MTGRLSRMRELLPALDSALQGFISSKGKFSVVRTVLPATSKANENTSIGIPSQSHSKTLYILDASFNPPSRAHLALACNPFTKPTQEQSRLLLLFSTHNADKSPSPASFTHRLAMMLLFAEDIALHLRETAPASSPPAIDVGLTSAPYYTDKSAAIAEADPSPYPSNPTHVHLLGYDTLTRLLAPKYYPDFNPPLSALAPYFTAGHGLRVLLRPNSSSDNAVSGDSEAEQRAFVEKLGEGSLEGEGFRREWAGNVDVVEGEKWTEGVSSTAVRKAAERGEWDVVERMCTPGVAAWVKEMGLYGGMSEEPKLA